MNLELHQLDLKYAALRVRDAARERRLLSSLGEHGQQSPLWVTATATEHRYVLIDGYARARARALRALGRDEAEVRVLAMSEVEALVQSQRLDNARERSALEEGWVLRALIDDHALAQCEVATRLDRSASWVSRRLDLVRVLPTSVQEAVRRGRIPPYSAQRVLVPLARANPALCERLVAGLGPRGASVRELTRIYEVWRRASAEQRERIAVAPRLFLQADAARREAERAAADPDAGEGELAACLRDLTTLASICLRRSGRLARARPVPKDWKEGRRLHGAWTRARAAFAALSAHLEDGEAPGDHGECDDHDDYGHDADALGDPGEERERHARS